MRTRKNISKLVTWLPSGILLLFFIPNAFNKLLNPYQTEKIISNPAIMIATGIFLVLAIALFLSNKTLLLGSTLLALYMTLIVCIHIYKGKPYEVAMLLVVAVVFAAYIRKPQIFHSED